MHKLQNALKCHQVGYYFIRRVPDVFLSLNTAIYYQMRVPTCFLPRHSVEVLAWKLMWLCTKLMNYKELSVKSRLVNVLVEKFEQVRASLDTYS